jgi:hypothetical protein
MEDEERRKAQRDVERAFRSLNECNQERLLRLAQHLAQHKLAGQLWLGEGEDLEPCCLCTGLN